MKWFGGRESSNVNDSRGSGFGGGTIVGGGLGTIVIAVIVYLLGGDPSDLIQQPSQQNRQAYVPEGGYDSTLHFTKIVIAQTEDVWHKIFEEMGRTYREPRMEYFNGHITSACGTASSASGPFYCPGDSKIYLDGSFFTELKERFKAPGDFANAYVIAHEVGHHVQHLLGTTDKLEEMRAYSTKKEANKLSVMLELQADFYAGIWAHYMRQRGDVVEDGDIEAALNAANAIGDDRLQQQTQGEVVPDAFTHGTSQQRMYWFKKGYETGDIKQGNTFKEMGGNIQ